MTLDDLLEEARRLARPCTWLVPAPAGRPVAVWSDSGAHDGHLLSIDAACLPDAALGEGLLSVYRGDEAATVEFRPGARLAAGRSDGTALHAFPRSSLPPPDALFRFGSARLHDWLRGHGWEPDWGYNGNFGQPAAAAYERAFQGQYPLYAGGAHAVLGGWHLPWPDGDRGQRLEARLLLTTFEDAEPWVEVWHDADGGLRAMERTT